MVGLRFMDIAHKPIEFLDLTSLTLEEFQELVPPFEAAFQAHMGKWRLDGKPRTVRSYTTYKNCPLPTAEDRLLFMLVYLKNNPLQVLHGRLFGMAQCKANVWLHVLLPVLRDTLTGMGDAPSRSLTELAKRLGVRIDEVEVMLSVSQETDEHPSPPAPLASTTSSVGTPPLFAMMEPNAVSNAPKIRINRHISIVARKSATQ